MYHKRWLPVILLFFCAPMWATTSAPVCLYQGVLSGPSSATGSEGGNGAYTELFGKNLSGATVTINGVSPAQTWYSATDITGNHEVIGLQVASTVTGTGAIVVTTGGGSCQFSSMTLTSCASSGVNGTLTFGYTGVEPLVGQSSFITGFTSASCTPFNGWPISVASATGSTFTAVNTIPTVGTVTATSDTGLFSNGGWTATSGNMYYIGSCIDNDSPGSGAAAFTFANFKAGTAGNGSGGSGTYSSPWCLTNQVNISIEAQVLISAGGTGYTSTSGVAYTPISNPSCTSVTFNISATAGAIVSASIGGSTTNCNMGDTFSITGGGGTGGVLFISGLEQNSYTYSTKRTPYSYYAGMSSGDTIVILDDVDFIYDSGYTSYVTSLLLNRGLTSLNIVARPDGGTVSQFGGYNTVQRGFANVGNVAADYDTNVTIEGPLIFEGSAVGGAALELDEAQNGATIPAPRVVDVQALCSNCNGPNAGVLGGVEGYGLDGSGNQAYPANIEFLGNDLEQIGCLNQAGKGVKEFHDSYMFGLNIEFGWNKINGICTSGPNSIAGGAAVNGAGATNCMQLNFQNDNAGGYWNYGAHDNDIIGCNSSAFNMASVDPTQGFVHLWNNIIRSTGMAAASDSATNNIAILFPGEAPTAGSGGTAYVFDNTLYDCSSNLNNVNYNLAACLYLSYGNFDDQQSGLNIGIYNNVFAQPSYTYSSSQNMLAINNSTTGSITGANNFWYTATPGKSGYNTIPNATGSCCATVPQFVNMADGPWTYFALQSTSPLIGAGTPNVFPPYDFSAYPSYNPPAIGALEFQAGLTPTLVSIAVNPATASCSVSGVLSFTAPVCTYSDGSTVNCTTNVVWSSSNTAAATINSSGTASCQSGGANQSTTISATWKGITGKATLTVLPQPSTFETGITKIGVVQVQ